MIPLSVPLISGNEWKYVKDCLDTGWISSVGSYVTDFENKMAEYTGAKYAVATMNGTAALHICMELIGVKLNDLVIIPNITFIATCNAIAYTGADALFIDVNKDNWQLDLDLFQEFLETQVEVINDECFHINTKRRISCMMPVHVLGNMNDLQRMMALANKYHLNVIEDSTESLGSYYNNKHTGTFGKMGCFSFNGNKIISTGGGGMIVTDDEFLAKKAKHITTQAKIHPDEYIHDQIGYNYRLVNILAAVGVAQMEQLPDFLLKKEAITNYYKTHLNNIGDIKFQTIEPNIKVNNWLPTISTTYSKQLFQHLKDNQIMSRPFWMPMNQLPMFRNNIYFNHNDVSNKVYQNSLSIPCSTGISEQELNTVVTKIKEIVK
jgi:perosamine synthetase